MSETIRLSQRHFDWLVIAFFIIYVRLLDIPGFIHGEERSLPFGA